MLLTYSIIACLYLPDLDLGILARLELFVRIQFSWRLRSGTVLNHYNINPDPHIPFPVPKGPHLHANARSSGEKYWGLAG